MTNYKLHENCKQLSWAVYQDEKPKIIVAIRKEILKL